MDQQQKGLRQPLLDLEADKTGAAKDQAGLSMSALRKAQRQAKREQMNMMVMPEEKPDGAAFLSYNGKEVFVYDERACFCCGDRVRHRVVSLISHPIFDRFIISMIFANSIVMAVYEYKDRENKEPWNQKIEMLGRFFTVVFSVECFLKITAMGFIVHKNSYLRDSWNWLDFSVVCLGIAELANILPAKDTKQIRILRVLRPLKSINSVPAMKRLVASLVASLNKLFDSVIIMTSCFLLFGILGVRQFKGLQYQRCRTTPEPVGKSWEIAPDIDRLCTMDGSGAFECPSQYTCGRVMDYPEVPFSSEDVNNIALISYGYMSFDNIGVAMLTILQMITLEGWTDLMYQLGDAASTWMVIAFCILIVITGSFFILNLVLTVIVDSFDDDVEKEVRIEAEKKAKRTRELKVLYGFPLSDSEDTEDEVIAPLSARSERGPAGDDEEVRLPERAQNNKVVFMFWYICQLEFFNLIMTIAIVINTYLLALDKYPMSKEYNQQLEKFNNFFSAVFFGEMVIKMIGLGLKDYMSDNFNIFDSCIVCTSVVEFLIALSGIKTSGGALTSLRTLRLLRVFKLARSWTSFRELLEKMIMTLKDITNFSVLMLLFVFICSLLGMELYAYRVKFNDNSKAFPLDPETKYDVGYYPRQNFNTLGNSFISVFGILIGENWNACMYDHLRGKHNGATYIFFIFLFIFGNLILLNLFLGILLKNFEEPPGKDEVAEGEDLTARERFQNLFIVNYKVETGDDPVREPLLLDDNRQEINRNKKDGSKVLFVYQPPAPRGVEKIFTISRAKKLQKQKQRKGASKKIQLTGKSLCVFSRVNSFRVWCKDLVGHRHFDTFILVMIGLSSIMLTFEGPNTDPNGSSAKVLQKLDYVVTLIFLCELLAKVVVYGLVANGPDSYLRSPWNILDFFIVSISIMLTAFQGQKLKNMKILRILRVLRPLRMIAKNPGMSIVVMSMLNGFKDIGNVMVVSVLFLGMFAILGTNLFKGSFYYCLTDNLRSGLVIVDKIDCMDYGGEWVNRDQHFDNVGAAAVTLFNVMTTEGWLGVMWHSVDAAGIDLNPQMNRNNTAEFFYVFFMVMGSLFILNMFVGVVINVFNQEKEKLERNYLLTEIQKEWCDILIKMYKAELLATRQESGQCLRDLCYNLVTHKLFDNGIMTCIVFNTFCMALTWYDQSPIIPQYLWYVNTFFNIVYTIEAALKLLALGKDYFESGWNIFDFTIVVATWTEEIIKLFIEINLSSSTAVIRTFRVGRIFKLLKKNKNLRVLFKTLIDAIPQLTNVGGIMLLILFIYSILGVSLFGKVMLQESLNVHANFQSFGTALLTLFRMATGESWNMIMYDAGRPASITFDCVASQEYSDIVENGIRGCGKPGLARLYFFSYMIVVALIFINLFIVIIFESFQESQIEEALKVGGKTIDLFSLFWRKYDPKGSGFIHRKDMQNLIIDIIEEELKQLAQLKQDIYDGEVAVEEFKTKIQMFALHKEETLVDITTIKEEGRENVEDEKDPHKLAQQMRDKRLIAKACMQFVHEMRLPFYGAQLDRFFFYDVLEGLSRNLFQNLVNDARKELMAQEPGLQGIDGDVSFRSLSNVQPAREDECVDEAEIEEEHRCDILRGAFDVILYKIEQKGRKHKIMKFDKMHDLRQLRNSRVILKQLSALEDVIFDSSYIKAAAVIAKHLKRWLKQREVMRKLQEKIAASFKVGPQMLKGRIDLKMERVVAGPDKKIVRGLNYRSLVGAQEQAIQDMEQLKKRAGNHNRFNSFVGPSEAQLLEQSRLEHEEDLDRDKVDQKSIDQFQKILAIQKLQLKNLQITRQISEIQSSCHDSFRDSNMSMLSINERTGRSYMEQFLRTRSNLFMKYIMIHLMEQLTDVDKFEEKGGHQTARFGEFMTYYNQNKSSPMPLFPGIQIFKIAMCSKTMMRQIMDRIKPLTFRDLKKYHELSYFVKLLMKKPDLSKYAKMNHEAILKYYKAWSYEHSVLRPVTPLDNGPKLPNSCLDIIWSQSTKHGGFYRLRNVRLGNGRTHFMDIDILLDPRINSSARHAFDTSSKLHFEKICHLLTGFARVYKFQIENKKSLKLDSMTEGFLYKGHLKEYGRQIEIMKDLSISIKVGFWEQKEFTSERCVLYKMSVPYGKWCWIERDAEGTKGVHICPLALYHAFQDPTKQNQIFVQKEPSQISSLKTNQPPKVTNPMDPLNQNDESAPCYRFF